MELGLIQYPGSPEQMPIDWMLDHKKYTDELLYLDQDIQISKFCINHKSKKSKFYVLENDEVKRLAGVCNFLRGVCSKCAVRLAKNMIPTISLESDLEERQKILNIFLKKVYDLKDNVKNSNDFMLQQKDQVNGHYMRQFQVLTDYEEKIDEIVRILDHNKKEMRSLIERELNQSLGKIEYYSNRLEKEVQGLQEMERDTTKNYENIIKKVNMESLQDILGGYEKRMSDAYNMGKAVENYQQYVITLKPTDEA